MSVAKVTEITSSSKKGFDDAIRRGIARASKTLKGIKGAWVQGQTLEVDKVLYSAGRAGSKRSMSPNNESSSGSSTGSAG